MRGSSSSAYCTIPITVASSKTVNRVAEGSSNGDWGDAASSLQRRRTAGACKICRNLGTCSAMRGASVTRFPDKWVSAVTPSAQSTATMNWESSACRVSLHASRVCSGPQ
jgi:hypothetical protein